MGCGAVSALSYSHAKPGAGSSAVLVSHLDLMMEFIGHQAVFMTLPAPLSV